MPRFTSTLLALASLLPALSHALAYPAIDLRWPQPSKPHSISHKLIYHPPDNYTDPRVLYVRTVQLPNKDILATWENYSPEPPPVWFPIWRSKDNGDSWTEIGRVQDQVNGWGLRYQPFLYVLPVPFGGYPAGTLLLAGSSIPTDLSKTKIDIYASRDSGRTWKYVSNVAIGGVAIPNNGLTPIWEPFLLYNPHNRKLICYYSDQRANETHGQKMVHQTTADLRHWGEVVDDVAYPTYTDRPGMPTVAKLPNGEYIFVYEYGGGPGFSNYQFPVYYRFSKDPEAFRFAPGIQLNSTDGVVPNGSPYVVWTPYGGKNGTIVVSSGCCSDIYLNKGLGKPGTPWYRVATPEPRSYTRSLTVLDGDGGKWILIAGGGKLPPSTTNNVTISVVDLSQYSV
ncbi:hypothetical protein ABW19_dt0209196 [Dactylella cylindrospora]|nr:hypothetical protein ABW19_dt0209196 [Dactylella cylindrospora]